jgi:hypothetical protein
MKLLPIFKSLSFYTVLAAMSILSWIDFSGQRWQERKIIDWDIISYYGYLPATFIRHDLALTFMEKKEVSNGEEYWFQATENGGRLIKTTMGMSILYSPFFYIAHTYTQQAGGIANGFTYHYQKAIFLAALFYVLIGLFFLRLLLLNFYNEWVTSIVIICIVFGTNLYNYITIDGAMSHAYNFSLIAIFLYYSIKWHEHQKLNHTIILGIIGGLIILIRPVNILIFIFPVLYNVYTVKDIKIKALLFWEQRKHIILILVIIFLCCLPQLLYWKYITGSFFFNSYVGEQFYFNNPHILEGLFGYRKGWLVYTPLMVFALLGLYSLLKERKQLFFPVLVFTAISIYVVFSWWAWWYGGGFGARALIDFYALFALSMAAFLQQVYDKKMLILSHTLVVVILFFIYLNLFQSRQFKYCSIHYDAMTKEAYWLHFLKTDCIDWPAFEKTLKSPDYDKARKGEEE